jgi:exosome complex RNA-binding protein Csl4
MILLSFVSSDFNACCPTLMEEYKCSVCGNMEVRKITKLKEKA